MASQEADITSCSFLKKFLLSRIKNQVYSSQPATVA